MFPLCPSNKPISRSYSFGSRYSHLSLWNLTTSGYLWHCTLAQATVLSPLESSEISLGSRTYSSPASLSLPSFFPPAWWNTLLQKNRSQKNLISPSLLAVWWTRYCGIPYSYPWLKAPQPTRHYKTIFTVLQEP